MGDRRIVVWFGMRLFFKLFSYSQNRIYIDGTMVVGKDNPVLVGLAHAALPAVAP